jgi:hypothetical protein
VTVAASARNVPFGTSGLPKTKFKGDKSNKIKANMAMVLRARWENSCGAKVKVLAQVRYTSVTIYPAARPVGST